MSCLPVLAASWGLFLAALTQVHVQGQPLFFPVGICQLASDPPISHLWFLWSQGSASSLTPETTLWPECPKIRARDLGSSLQVRTEASCSRPAWGCGFASKWAADGDPIHPECPEGSFLVLYQERQETESGIMTTSCHTRTQPLRAHLCLRRRLHCSRPWHHAGWAVPRAVDKCPVNPPLGES